MTVNAGSKSTIFSSSADLRAAPQKSELLLLGRIVNAAAGLYYLLRKWMSVFVVSDTLSMIEYRVKYIYLA